MKILKGTHIREKDGLAKLTANITLNDEVASDIRATARYHFLNDSRDRPLYRGRRTFGQREGRANYYQGRRIIYLHTSEGKLTGIVFWRKSFHAKIKGNKDFVGDFYEILGDRY